MYKKRLLFLIVLSSFFNLVAQQSQGIKLRIEPGIVVLSNTGNLELLLNAEPKIEISEDIAIGMRFGVALNAQEFKSINSDFFIDDESDNAVISFTPTFDYYLNEDKYRPYLGLGIGYYVFSYVDLSRRNGSGEVLEGSTNNKLGFLTRGGFELGNTRVGLEYNFIPKADIEIPNNEIIGEVKSAYLGISIGFTL